MGIYENKWSCSETHPHHVTPLFQKYKRRYHQSFRINLYLKKLMIVTACSTADSRPKDTWPKVFQISAPYYNLFMHAT